MPSEPMPPGTPAGRRLPWLAIGLFVSVLLNLFLAGVMTGRLTGPGPLAEMFGAAPAAQLARPVLARFRALPAVERERFRVAMAAHRDALRPAVAELWRARLHALAMLATPTYDPHAMADAFAAVRQATTQAQVAQHDALVQAIGALSPAARARLASPVRDNGG